MPRTAPKSTRFGKKKAGAPHPFVRHSSRNMNTHTQSQPSAAKSTPKHTRLKGPWLVACITGRLGPGKKYLSPGKNPRRLHPSLREAAEECIRLAGLFPGEQFAMFECIGCVEVPK